MKNQQSIVTQLTLANASQLVSEVCSEILNSSSGVDNTIGDLPLNEEMLQQLSQSTFQSEIENIIKGI